MNVVVVEKLGAVCAFKPKEIQVLKSVYDRVPDISKDDFEVILNKACEEYHNRVDIEKSKGIRPKSAAIKSAVISEVINPFLENLGVQEKVERVRTVRPKKPRITDAKDPVVVSLTDSQKKTASSYYDNNFNDEILDDSVESTEELVDFGEVPDEFDLVDDFDFEGLR